MAVAHGQVADPDLGLGAVGLVDEDHLPAVLRLAIDLRKTWRTRRCRQPLDETLHQPLGRLLVDVTGEPDHEVAGNDLASPDIDRALALDLRKRGVRTERGAAVGMTGAAQPVKP